MEAKKPPFYSEIWDSITAAGCMGEPFKLSEIAYQLSKKSYLRPYTARDYVRLFRIFAEHEPEHFSGPKSKLVRIKAGLYRLDDNPER